MYKVLLVDDEYYILQRLKTCIQWENEGFKISGTAQNADTALSLLTENKYDLAVVDISMPQKSGLDFIKELKQNDISVKIIILSGYGTFEYAQKAIQYGVTEYLLKPINEVDLISSLKKIRQVLDSEQEIKKLYTKQTRTNYLLETIKKENFFKKIFTNYPLLFSDIDDLNSHLKEYDLKEQTLTRILVFDLGSDYFASMSLSDIQLYQYAVNNALCEILMPHFKITNSSDIFNHGVFVCTNFTDNTVDFLQCIDRASKKIKQSLGLIISIGISPSFPLSLKNLNAEYYHALIAYVLNNLKTSSYTMYNDTKEYVSCPVKTEQLLTKISACYSSGEADRLRLLIDELFSQISKQGYSFLALDQILFKLTTVCCSDNVKTPASISESDELSFLLGYKELLFSGYNLEYIKQKMLQLFLSSDSTSSTATSRLVNDAVKFIDAHYCRNDISLVLISKNLLISPSYLSSIFKKEKGISVNQYITQLRMEKSKDFLNNDQLTLTEVAERVGYRDSFYFSKVFKRYFGISPSVYRN